MATKTELEFNYEPNDFFEAPLSLAGKHGTLAIENGKAVYVLGVPADPMPSALKDDVAEETAAAFKARQLLVNRPFKLLPPCITQHGLNGRLARTIEIGMAEEAETTDSMDVIVTDHTGTTTYDSRAERIEQHRSFVESVLSKAGNATLRAMLDSYERAMQHPSTNSCIFTRYVMQR